MGSNESIQVSILHKNLELGKRCSGGGGVALRVMK